MRVNDTVVGGLYRLDGCRALCQVVSVKNYEEVSVEILELASVHERPIDRHTVGEIETIYASELRQVSPLEELAKAAE